MKAFYVDEILTKLREKQRYSEVKSKGDRNVETMKFVQARGWDVCMASHAREIVREPHRVMYARVGPACRCNGLARENDCII